MAMTFPTVAFLAPDRGVLRVAGADRVAFLHNMTTADVKGLAPGHGMPGAIVNQKGQVLDWVGIHADDDALWVVTSLPRLGEVAAWLDKYVITEDVAIADHTTEATRFFLTGPGAEALAGVAPWTVAGTALAGLPVRVLGAPGWGGPGYLLEAAPGDAAAVADALAAAGAADPGPEARAWLRVATGVPTAGHELTERTNPWEARLDAAVSLAKGCYLGQEVVARLQAYDKVQRLLVGLDLPEGAVVAPGDALLDPADPDGARPLGEVTSVAPGTDGPAAVLGFVKRAAATPGTGVMVRGADGTKISATVGDRWFWAP